MKLKGDDSYRFARENEYTQQDSENVEANPSNCDEPNDSEKHREGEARVFN